MVRRPPAASKTHYQWEVNACRDAQGVSPLCAYDRSNHLGVSLTSPLAALGLVTRGIPQALGTSKPTAMIEPLVLAVFSLGFIAGSFAHLPSPAELTLSPAGWPTRPDLRDDGSDAIILLKGLLYRSGRHRVLAELGVSFHRLFRADIGRRIAKLVDVLAARYLFRQRLVGSNLYLAPDEPSRKLPIRGARNTRVQPAIRGGTPRLALGCASGTHDVRAVANQPTRAVCALHGSTSRDVLGGLRGLWEIGQKRALSEWP